MKVQLNLSTAYHPPIDGQTEVVNKCVECFMRCMTGEKPKEWVQWVSLAEYWYNTNYHNSAHTTPFEIVYGHPPNLHLPYIAGTSAIEEADRTMQAKEQAIAMLQFHLKRSHDRIKSIDDKKRSDKSFEVGMKVTYKLDLPADNQIHPVFHVSQLKLCNGTNHQVGVLPHCGPDGVLSVEPEAIIRRRLGKLNNKDALSVLVKWNECYDNEDELQSFRHKAQQQDKVYEEHEESCWILHLRNGIFYPKGHEGVMNEVPDGAAIFSSSKVMLFANPSIPLVAMGRPTTSLSLRPGPNASRGILSLFVGLVHACANEHRPQQQETMTNRVRHLATSVRKRNVVLDDKVVAFHDIMPSAFSFDRMDGYFDDRHYLMIPVDHIATVKDLQRRTQDYSLGITRYLVYEVI
ncbi:retrotransposable element Tf2 [Tanacetum coccineum]